MIYLEVCLLELRWLQHVEIRVVVLEVVSDFIRTRSALVRKNLMVDSRVLTLVLFLGCILEARVPTLLTELVNRDLLTRRRILDYWNALTAFEAPDQIRSISCVSRSK